MRLPWPKKRDDTPRPDVASAERDLARSRRQLEETHAETDYYRELGHDLRRIRVDNHLAETFRFAARGRHQHG